MIYVYFMGFGCLVSDPLLQSPRFSYLIPFSVPSPNLTSSRVLILLTSESSHTIPLTWSKTWTTPGFCKTSSSCTTQLRSSTPCYLKSFCSDLRDDVSGFLGERVTWDETKLRITIFTLKFREGVQL